MEMSEPACSTMTFYRQGTTSTSTASPNCCKAFSAPPPCPSATGKSFHSRSAFRFRRGFVGVVGLCRRAGFCRARRELETHFAIGGAHEKRGKRSAFAGNEPMQKIGFSGREQFLYLLGLDR